MWFRNKKPETIKPLGKFEGPPGGAIQKAHRPGGLIATFRPVKDFQCDDTGGMYLVEFTYKLHANEPEFKARCDRWKELDLIKWL